MVTFEIESDRVIPVRPGFSKPYFEVIYGRILDVEIAEAPDAVAWDEEEDHPILIGDPLPSKYRMKFKQAPNVVYNEILLLQQHAESIPGLEAGQFVTIVTKSAWLLDEQGEPLRQLELGEFLPI